MRKPKLVFNNTVSQLHKLTSMITGVDEETVRLITNQQFLDLRKFHKRPEKARFTLRYLFTLEGNIKNISGYVRSNINDLRKDRDNEELKEELRHFWKYRQDLIKFYHYNKKYKKKLKDVYRLKREEALQQNNSHSTITIEEQENHRESDPS